METVLKAIADWIKGILTAGIMSNLSGLFDAVNEQVGDIAQQVGTRPSAFEPRVFAMIESLSRNAVSYTHLVEVIEYRHVVCKSVVVIQSTDFCVVLV